MTKQKTKTRLTKQMQGVYDCINMGSWKTVEEISKVTGYPHIDLSPVKKFKKRKVWWFGCPRKVQVWDEDFEYKLNGRENV